METQKQTKKISQLNLGYDSIKKVWFDRYGRRYKDDEVENGNIKPYGITEEEILKVMKFDEQIQEDGNKQAERELNYIFESATGKGKGWRGIANEDPDNFRRALKYIEEEQ